MEEVTAAAAAPKLSSEQEANSHDLKEQHSANDSSSILLASNSNCTETSMAASTSITPIITQPPIGCNSVSKSEEIFSSADGDGIFNDSSSRVHHLSNSNCSSGGGGGSSMNNLNIKASTDQEQEHQQQTSLLSSPPRHTNNNNMNNSDDNNSSSTNEEDLNTSGEMSILSGSCSSSSSSNNSSLHNSSKGENYTCQFCSRCYTDKNRFEIHVRFHTGETPYVCPICNKGFRDGKKMKIHVGRHTSSLTHKCHLCPRSFEGPRALNKHLLAHKMKNYISPKSNKINQLKTSTPAPLPNIPPPRPPSDSTISLTMDDLIQYAQPLPEMHESVLQEKLIEGAAKVVPVTMEEFKTDSEFPDLLDSMSSVQDTYAKMNSIPVSSSDSHVSTPISCSGLSGSTPTFTTLSGVEPEYPAHLALKPNITGGPPIVLARKSAAPPPPPKAKKDSSHGSSKSSSLSSSKHTLVSQNIKQQISTTPNVPVLVSKPEALVTALASEAVAQLAKAKINLPAGTCIVPASASQKNESQESLVANPAITTTSSVAVADPKGGPPSTVPSQPMTITIQYKIYPDQKGEEPRTVSVKRDLADLIKETPARSSSQSSISSEKTVASPGVTPFPEINKVQIEPKKIDPAKETRPVITPAGNKYDVPTVVTGGYDLDNLMCTFCDRRFKNEKTLMGHMLNHFGVAPKMASCPECGLTLQKKSYARHLRLHGNIAPQVCTICKKEFREKRSLDKHIKVVHGGEQSYPCNYCPETFKTAIEQKNHVDSHVYQFECDICHLKFQKSESLNNHYKVHTGEKPFSCEICDKSFASEKVKRNHVLKHQGSLPHKCEVCYMTFQSKAHLVKHESSHTRQTQVISAKINTFLESFSASLENDMQVIGFDNAESSSGIVTSGGMIFPENLDEAAAEAAQIFQNDILQSDGDDLLVNESFPEKVIPIINTLSSSSTEEENIIHCSMCTAKLNSKRSYLIHLKRHVGLNNFKCKYCDKSFQSKFRLNRHLKNHAKEGSNITPPPSSPTGEKSTDDAQIFETIKCALCPKTFTDNESLQIHTISHFEDDSLIRSAAYQRKLRRRSLFRRSYRLRSLHRAKHISSLDLNNNVYNCTVCCVSLKRKTSLFIHKMKHGGKSWRCDSCGDLFSHSSKLNSHLLENHDMLKKDIRSKGLLKHSYIYKIWNNEEEPPKLSIQECEMEHYKSNLSNQECVDLGSNSFRTLEGPPPPIVVNATPVQGPTETTTMILQTPQISIPQPEVVSPVIQVLPVNVSDLYQGGNNISNVPLSAAAAAASMILQEKKSIHPGSRLIEDESMFDVSTLSCLACNKTFKNLRNFRVHKSRHQGTLNHKCPDCIKTFGGRAAINRHMIAIHGRELRVDEETNQAALSKQFYGSQSGYSNRQIVQVSSVCSSAQVVSTIDPLIIQSMEEGQEGEYHQPINISPEMMLQYQTVEPQIQSSAALPQITSEHVDKVLEPIPQSLQITPAVLDASVDNDPPQIMIPEILTPEPPNVSKESIPTTISVPISMPVLQKELLGNNEKLIDSNNISSKENQEHSPRSPTPPLSIDHHNTLEERKKGVISSVDLNIPERLNKELSQEESLKNDEKFNKILENVIRTESEISSSSVTHFASEIESASQQHSRCNDENEERENISRGVVAKNMPILDNTSEFSEDETAAAITVGVMEKDSSKEKDNETDNSIGQCKQIHGQQTDSNTQMDEVPSSPGELKIAYSIEEEDLSKSTKALSMKGILGSDEDSSSATDDTSTIAVPSNISKLTNLHASSSSSSNTSSSLGNSSSSSSNNNTSTSSSSSVSTMMDSSDIGLSEKTFNNSSVKVSIYNENDKDLIKDELCSSIVHRLESPESSDFSSPEVMPSVRFTRRSKRKSESFQPELNADFIEPPLLTSTPAAAIKEPSSVPTEKRRPGRPPKKQGSPFKLEAKVPSRKSQRKKEEQVHHEEQMASSDPVNNNKCLHSTSDSKSRDETPAVDIPEISSEDSSFESSSTPLRVTRNKKFHSLNAKTILQPEKKSSAALKAKAKKMPKGAAKTNKLSKLSCFMRIPRHVSSKSADPIDEQNNSRQSPPEKSKLSKSKNRLKIIEEACTTSHEMSTSANSLIDLKDNKSDTLSSDKFNETSDVSQNNVNLSEESTSLSLDKNEVAIDSKKKNSLTLPKFTIQNCLEMLSLVTSQILVKKPNSSFVGKRATRSSRRTTIQQENEITLLKEQSINEESIPPLVDECMSSPKESESETNVGISSDKSNNDESLGIEEDNALEQSASIQKDDRRVDTDTPRKRKYRSKKDKEEEETDSSSLKNLSEIPFNASSLSKNSENLISTEIKGREVKYVEFKEISTGDDEIKKLNDNLLSFQEESARGETESRETSQSTESLSLSEDGNKEVLLSNEEDGAINDDNNTSNIKSSSHSLDLNESNKKFSVPQNEESKMINTNEQKNNGKYLNSIPQDRQHPELKEISVEALLTTYDEEKNNSKESKCLVNNIDNHMSEDATNIINEDCNRKTASSILVSQDKPCYKKRKRKKFEGPRRRSARSMGVINENQAPLDSGIKIKNGLKSSDSSNSDITNETKEDISSSTIFDQHPFSVTDSIVKCIQIISVSEKDDEFEDKVIEASVTTIETQCENLVPLHSDENLSEIDDFCIEEQLPIMSCRTTRSNSKLVLESVSPIKGNNSSREEDDIHSPSRLENDSSLPLDNISSSDCSTPNSASNLHKLTALPITESNSAEKHEQAYNSNTQTPVSDISESVPTVLDNKDKTVSDKKSIGSDETRIENNKDMIPINHHESSALSTPSYVEHLQEKESKTFNDDQDFLDLEDLDGEPPLLVIKPRILHRRKSEDPGNYVCDSTNHEKDPVKSLRVSPRRRRDKSEEKCRKEYDVKMTKEGPTSPSPMMEKRFSPRRYQKNEAPVPIKQESDIVRDISKKMDDSPSEITNNPSSIKRRGRKRKELTTTMIHDPSPPLLSELADDDKVKNMRTKSCSPGQPMQNNDSSLSENEGLISIIIPPEKRCRSKESSVVEEGLQPTKLTEVVITPPRRRRGRPSLKEKNSPGMASPVREEKMSTKKDMVSSENAEKEYSPGGGEFTKAVNPQRLNIPSTLFTATSDKRGKKVFSCTLCRKNFNRRDKINYHIFRDHNEHCSRKKEELKPRKKYRNIGRKIENFENDVSKLLEIIQEKRRLRRQVEFLSERGKDDDITRQKDQVSLVRKQEILLSKYRRKSDKKSNFVVSSSSLDPSCLKVSIKRLKRKHLSSETLENGKIRIFSSSKNGTYSSHNVSVKILKEGGDPPLDISSGISSCKGGGFEVGGKGEKRNGGGKESMLVNDEPPRKKRLQDGKIKKDINNKLGNKTAGSSPSRLIVIEETKCPQSVGKAPQTTGTFTNEYLTGKEEEQEKVVVKRRGRRKAGRPSSKACNKMNEEDLGLEEGTFADVMKTMMSSENCSGGGVGGKSERNNDDIVTQVPVTVVEEEKEEPERKNRRSCNAQKSCNKKGKKQNNTDDIMSSSSFQNEEEERQQQPSSTTTTTTILTQSESSQLDGNADSLSTPSAEDLRTKKPQNKLAIIRRVFSTYTKKRKFVVVKYRKPLHTFMNLEEYLERIKRGEGLDKKTKLLSPLPPNEEEPSCSGTEFKMAQVDGTFDEDPPGHSPNPPPQTHFLILKRGMATTIGPPPPPPSPLIKTEVLKQDLYLNNQILTGEESIRESVSSIIANNYNMEFTNAEQEEEETNNFICSLCSQGMPTRKSYEAHLMRHKGLSFQCDRCPKAFKDKGDLDLHQRTQHTSSSSTPTTMIIKTEPSESTPPPPPPIFIMKQEPVLISPEEHADFSLPDALHLFDNASLMDSSDSAIHLSLDELPQFSQHDSTTSFDASPGFMDFVNEESSTTNGNSPCTSVPELRSESGTPGSLPPDDGEFPCTHCEKKFGNRRNLNSHMRRHTGDYKLFCDHCGKGFFTKSKLDSHRTKHTGEKPFRCLMKTCLKRFRYKGDLSKHIKRYHPGHTQPLTAVPIQDDELMTLQASAGLKKEALPVIVTVSRQQIQSSGNVVASTMVQSPGGVTVVPSSSSGVSMNHGSKLFLPLLPQHPVKPADLLAAGMAIKRPQLPMSILSSIDDPSLDDNILNMLTSDEAAMSPASSSVPSSAPSPTLLTPVIQNSSSCSSSSSSMVSPNLPNPSSHTFQIAKTNILHDVLTQNISAKSSFTSSSGSSVSSVSSGSILSNSLINTTSSGSSNFIIPSSILKPSSTAIFQTPSSSIPTSLLNTVLTTTAKTFTLNDVLGTYSVSSNKSGGGGKTINVITVAPNSSGGINLINAAANNNKTQSSLIQQHSTQQGQTIVSTSPSCSTPTSRPDLSATALLPSRPVKPFPCTHPGCNRSFEKANLLRRHAKLHSGDCKFVCDICKKCFESQSKLDDHYRKHTGEKPFHCHVCGNSFRYKGDRTKHLKNIHGVLKTTSATSLTTNSSSSTPPSTTTSATTSSTESAAPSTMISLGSSGGSTGGTSSTSSTPSLTESSPLSTTTTSSSSNIVLPNVDLRSFFITEETNSSISSFQSTSDASLASSLMESSPNKFLDPLASAEEHHRNQQQLLQHRRGGMNGGGGGGPGGILTEETITMSLDEVMQFAQPVVTDFY
ncbi:uncharacterized protein [Lepeophtheirus salmonis]|uniref:uncharacterized protein n=1 Tax=Lepeophtheirus salmonis TaxID=72036 RepID=UPI003AF370B7